MTRRSFVLIGCVLLLAPAASAQSRGNKANDDPISGTWTGELKPDNAPRARQVSMELKFDGKRAVTGTVAGMPSPADIKSGTFDPKTGALMLQLGKQGETAALLTLEGTLANGTATGRVTGDGTGEFTITKKK